MNIGQAIKNIREKHDETQEQLATATGVIPQYISSIENGKKHPSNKLLKSIAEHYKAPVIFLQWQAIEEKDIPVNKLPIYRTLRPSIDALLSTLI